jgi:ABC-type nitrate/sulfonate/bicarbonate transport system substrate-binding protein
MLQKIIIAGVPEQVNIPIQICQERGIFEKYGLDVEFRIVPEGTGKMLDLIEKEEVDIAITVTDAFIAARAKGRPINLVGTWVSSPLVWAVAGPPSHETAASIATPTTGSSGFSHADRRMDNPCLKAWTDTIANEKLRFGVSRLGSGSHTMAHYVGMLNNIESSNLDFVVAGAFNDLCQGK